MMRLRSRFGRRSLIPATAWICGVVAVGAAFYAMGAWRISVLWPAVDPDGRMSMATACLCIRDGATLTRVVEITEWDYWPTLRDESIAPSDKVIVKVCVDRRAVRPWHAFWSATSDRTMLSFVKVASSSAATGAALTPEESLEVLGHVRAVNGTRIPPALQSAAALSVSEPITDGVIHEWTRKGALLLALVGVGLWGVARDPG